jgi:hypothetical protein
VNATLSPHSATCFQPRRMLRLLWGPSLIAALECQKYIFNMLTMSTNNSIIYINGLGCPTSVATVNNSHRSYANIAPFSWS